LLILIFVLSVLKILLDLRRKRPKGFILRESIIFLLIMAVLVILDLKFAADLKTEEESVETAEKQGQVTREEARERKLLSRIEDYTRALTHSDKPQVELFLKQGLEHKINQDYLDALEIFRQALDLNLTDAERLAFFILMGNSEAHLKEYNSAANYYYQAQRLSEDAGNDTALAVVFSNLAVVFQLADDPDESLENYFGLLRIFEKLGNISGQKNTLADIAFLHQMKGDTDSAAVYQKKSLEILGSDLDLLSEAAQMNNLALIYRSKGSLDTALLLHQRALQLFRQAGDKRDEASVLSNIGLIHQETGELEKALQYYRQAFAIDSTIGDAMGQGSDLNNIGSVLEQKGDLAEAKESYQKALSFFEKIDAQREIGFVRSSIERLEAGLKD
jgi:tetratricopeptide (TPR) repeat protein